MLKGKTDLPKTSRNTKSQPGAARMGSFANGQSGSELDIQMPAMGSNAVLKPTTPIAPRCPRLDMAMVVTRAAALVMALLSMSLMISAKQRGSLIIFGIEIPLYAKWSLSDSLE